MNFIIITDYAVTLGDCGLSCRAGAAPRMELTRGWGRKLLHQSAAGRFCWGNAVRGLHHDLTVSARRQAVHQGHADYGERRARVSCRRNDRGADSGRLSGA